LSRKEPEYPLDSVHGAAKQGNVVFRPGPERDIQNLRYFRDGAISVLLSLEAKDFHRVEDYSQQGVTKRCDVYLPSVENDFGSFDDLYIKLQFNYGWLIVHSFHLQR